MQIKPKKASNVGSRPQGKNSSGLLLWQVRTVMNSNASCFIYLDSSEVTQTQSEKKLEGFKGLIEDGREGATKESRD